MTIKHTLPRVSASCSRGIWPICTQILRLDRVGGNDRLSRRIADDRSRQRSHVSLAQRRISQVNHVEGEVSNRPRRPPGVRSRSTLIGKKCKRKVSPVIIGVVASRTRYFKMVPSSHSAVVVGGSRPDGQTVSSAASRATEREISAQTEVINHSAAAAATQKQRR